MIWEIDDKKKVIEGLDADGRPDPAYAQALGMLQAPLNRRALAFACDVAFFVLLQVPMLIGAVPLLIKMLTGTISAYGFVNHPSFVLAVVTTAITVVLSLVYAIVQWVLHARKGMTIGKAIAGIRSVNVRTLEKPKAGPVLLRYLIVAAAGIIPFFGPAFFLISPMFDAERRGRGLHDKATGVWLVDVRNGLNPFDEKRMRVARKMVKAEPTRERSALPSLATAADAEQPAYRPGGRVSAGVLGVARPHAATKRPVIGLATPTVSAEPVQPQAGQPILGGYRSLATDLSAPAETAAPAPAAPAAGSGTLHISRPSQTQQSQSESQPQPDSQTASASAPAEPVTPAPAAAPPQPRARVRFGIRLDSGESIMVTEPILLGRNPDGSAHHGARPIALNDDSRSLSKTHMLIKPVEGGLEILDLQSTNGSGLVRAGIEYVVAAGSPVMTIEGDTIRLGDRSAAVVRV